jgi:transcriptional regulator with XRE-family HTH domain
VTDQVHKLGEVLRAAREAKGVDLVRVERDTKIRERYLAALEAGEYRELPGSVYTKGFLRNYGAYLGLDPEYLIDLYRIETSTGPERPAMAAPPRPLGAKRSRAFVVTPGAVVAAILTLLVGGLFAYLGYELITFARMPELRVIEPPGNVSGHRDLTITLRGVTEPNARVTASGLRENPTVQADAEGSFTMTVELLPGSNVITLEAEDDATGRRSEPETRTVLVASEPDPSASTPPTALSVTSPEADATTGGEVAIAGTGAPNAMVTVTAAPTGPPAVNVQVVDAADAPVEIQAATPSAPEPVTLQADAVGAFAGSVTLAPGAWEVTVVADGTQPVVRPVTVTPSTGLRATLRVGGGASYVEADGDGTPAEGSGTIVADGDDLTVTGERELRIRVGNAGAVRLRVNGVDLGPMGGDGEVVEWRIRPADG